MGGKTALEWAQKDGGDSNIIAMLERAGTETAAERKALFAVAEKRQHRARHGVGVEGRNIPGGVAADFPRRGDIRRHNRLSERHRLDERQAEGLAKR